MAFYFHARPFVCTRSSLSEHSIIIWIKYGHMCLRNQQTDISVSCIDFQKQYKTNICLINVNFAWEVNRPQPNRLALCSSDIKNPNSYGMNLAPSQSHPSKYRSKSSYFSMCTRSLLLPTPCGLWQRGVGYKVPPLIHSTYRGMILYLLWTLCMV